MNGARRLGLILSAIVAVAITASACGKKVPPAAPAPAPPPAAAAAPPAPPPPPAPAATPPATPRAPTEEEVFSRKSLDQLNAEKPMGDAFFDYDKAEIRPESRAVLQKNADFMKKWASVVVSVEGHCDVRGSSEYNLALGSRRAGAVKDYMVGLGVAANRVTVLSKGKEQPFCTEESEACWQQNRRGHFIVTAK
jgi:peptidoglycan-associated lipoprotein